MIATATSLPLEEAFLSLPIAAREELFIIAGESSGDYIGSLLIKSLKQELPELPILGVGGAKMVEAGLIPVAPYESLQVMGIWEVLKKLPQLIRCGQSLINTIITRQPKGIVFIDFPGFNLRLADTLRQRGYKGKLIHFVSPSVWAWRKKRIEKIVKNLDLLLLIYPFEKEVYAPYPLKNEFVGHPLLERLQQTVYDPLFKSHFKLDSLRPLLALFPGSRTQELSLNLPLIKPIVEKFLLKHPEFQVAISLAREEHLNLMSEKLKGSFKYVTIPSSHTYDLMKHASVALAKSGTVNLELAWHRVPTSVVYGLSRVDRFLGKWVYQLDELPYYSIVNILLQEGLFPEWIKEGAPPNLVVQSLEKIMGPSRKIIEEGCEKVWDLLKPPTHLSSSQLAARMIRNLLSTCSNRS